MRHCVAGHDVVSQVLLDAGFALGQFALVDVIARRHLHRHGLARELAIGRAVVQRDGLTAGQTLHLGGDGHGLTAKHRGVFWPHVDDPDAGGRIDVGPGPNHAADGSQRILGRDHLVQRGHEEHGQEDVADLD